jgi:hypothetical protein
MAEKTMEGSILNGEDTGKFLLHTLGLLVPFERSVLLLQKFTDTSSHRNENKYKGWK